MLVVVSNFTPEARSHYRIGAQFRGTWTEIFNSDHHKYAGSGVINQGLLYTSPVKYHGKDYSISITLPPLGVSVLKLHEEMAEFEIE